MISNPSNNSQVFYSVRCTLQLMRKLDRVLRNEPSMSISVEKDASLSCKDALDVEVNRFQGEVRYNVVDGMMYVDHHLTYLYLMM